MADDTILKEILGGVERLEILVNQLVDRMGAKQDAIQADVAKMHAEVMERIDRMQRGG